MPIKQLLLSQTKLKPTQKVLHFQKVCYFSTLLLSNLQVFQSRKHSNFACIASTTLGHISTNFYGKVEFWKVTRASDQILASCPFCFKVLREKKGYSSVLIFFFFKVCRLQFEPLPNFTGHYSRFSTFDIPVVDLQIKLSNFKLMRKVNLASKSRAIPQMSIKNLTLTLQVSSP